MDHSDHHRVKYFCETVGLKYHLGYPWGVPRPPNPLTPKIPIGGALWGAEIYFGGLLLMDHSDHQRVKYFCEAVGFKYHLGYPWGVPRPPNPLPPKIPIWGDLWGGQGAWMRGSYNFSDP